MRKWRSASWKGTAESVELHLWGEGGCSLKRSALAAHCALLNGAWTDSTVAIDM